MDKSTYKGLLNEAKYLEIQAKRIGDVAERLRKLDVSDENRSGLQWMIETLGTVSGIVQNSVRHIRYHADRLEAPTLRAWILRARNDGRTQGDIAARLGLTQTAVSSILKGDTLLKDYNPAALKRWKCEDYEVF